MYNNQFPKYLCNLTPNSVSGTTSYNLRNKTEIQGSYSRTASYAKSFLPGTIHLWNSLPNSKASSSLTEFKRLIAKTENKIYVDLNYGTCFCQVTHCRLRLGCSDLNADKYSRHLIDSPCCCSGYQTENALHYFLTCRNYAHIYKT